MPVGMLPEGENVEDMGYLNDMRGRLELEVISNKIWGIRVK